MTSPLSIAPDHDFIFFCNTLAAHNHSLVMGRLVHTGFVWSSLVAHVLHYPPPPHANSFIIDTAVINTHNHRPEKIPKKAGCTEWDEPAASGALFLAARRFLLAQVASMEFFFFILVIFFTWRASVCEGHVFHFSLSLSISLSLSLSLSLTHYFSSLPGFASYIQSLNQLVLDRLVLWRAVKTLTLGSRFAHNIVRASSNKLFVYLSPCTSLSAYTRVHCHRTACSAARGYALHVRACFFKFSKHIFTLRSSRRNTHLPQTSAIQYSAGQARQTCDSAGVGRERSFFVIVIINC
jgi:hypothetical protein